MQYKTTCDFVDHAEVAMEQNPTKASSK